MHSRGIRYAFLIAGLLLSPSAWAHFGMILPSDDIVTAQDSRTLQLNVMFLHPFEQAYLNMEKPVQFGVVVQGKKQDLRATLRERKVGKSSTWVAEYPIRRPGDHVFYCEPVPYFEPAEDKFIVHYTKVIVNALGMEVGWDVPVGLRAEIVPLTRPYGIWAGNVFQGQVLIDGQPAPDTEVEVEYYNTDGIQPPADAFITQVIKTDPNGIFTYSLPKAGWWGFAALSTAPQKRKHTDGKEYDVELGAVLWVKATEMP